MEEIQHDYRDRLEANAREAARIKGRIRFIGLLRLVVFVGAVAGIYLLREAGAKEVHIRPACPPLLFGCPFLNFSRSKSEMDLITRRIIAKREGDNVSREVLDTYADPDSQNYKEMLEDIEKELNFTTLHFHRLDDLLASIGIEPCKVCTYCFNGK